jgi:hypothetical protein
LGGKVRIDNLKAVKGMRWIVSCVSAAGTVLAESEYFLQSTPWNGFTLALKVPEHGCEAQIIGLDLDAVDARRPDLSGSVWFDDVAISLVR